MKIVNLCSAGSCCPVLKVYDKYVEIGEKGNLCTLKMEEWQTLKNKILEGDV